MDDLAPHQVAPVQEQDRATQHGSLALALALVALAGWVDAVGVVQWGELYVSFMSGNTTALGASPAIGDWDGAWEAGRAVLIFLAGVVLGEIVGPAAKDWRGPAVLAVEAALLWLAVWSVKAGCEEATTVSITGLAMGVQTAAVHRADGISVALTYVTGTLVNLGRGIAAALRGQVSWRAPLPFLGFWSCMLVGAVAGSVVARSGLADALVTAAAIASGLTLFAGLAARREED